VLRGNAARVFQPQPEPGCRAGAPRTFFSRTFNQIAVRYDPATGMAGASINGTDLGSFPAGLAATPKFVGIEGVGGGARFFRVSHTDVTPAKGLQNAAFMC